jgi:hypothetical protein
VPHHHFFTGKGMNMTQNTVLDAKAGVGSQGLEEAPEVGFAEATISAPGGDQPKTRNVTLVVPADLPDGAIKTAWQIGMNTLQQMNQGIMVCLFPTSQQGADGIQPAVGQFLVLLTKDDDIKRMMTLGQVISQVNQKILLAKQASPSSELAARIEGTKAKDNAAADLKAQAQGRPGGIVIASR